VALHQSNMCTLCEVKRVALLMLMKCCTTPCLFLPSLAHLPTGVGITRAQYWHPEQQDSSDSYI